MLKRFSALTGAIIIVVSVFGCASQRDSLLDKNWGRSFETAKYNQIIDPDAGKNLTPVSGLDGIASENNTAKYLKGFTSDAPPPVYNINISDIGKVNGGN